MVITTQLRAFLPLALAWLVCGPFGSAAAQETGALRLAQAGPVVDQDNNPFAALVGARRDRKRESARSLRIERYVLASDDRVFLFEDRGSSARMKFLCTPDDERIDCALDPEGTAAEIHILTPTRGPRGDVIYKNAEGETMLRLASYGGATVFWPGDNSGGRAASRSFGDDAILAIEAADLATAERRAKLASALISDAVGAKVSFELGVQFQSLETNAGNRADVLADAVIRAAAGLYDVASDQTGARVIAERINRVLITPGPGAGVTLEDKTLIVEILPDGGLSGRPASATIVRFLEETL